MLVVSPSSISRIIGTYIVAGSWAFDSEYRGGLLFGARWMEFRWPRAQELAVVFDASTKEYDRELLSRDNAFRERLLSSGEFQRAHRGLLDGFTPEDIPLEVFLEVYLFKGRVSTAAVASARNELKRSYRRAALRHRAKKMGRGPISPRSSRSFAQWLRGRRRLRLLSTTFPKRETSAWLVDSRRVYLFMGKSEKLVADTAEAYLSSFLDLPIE